ncbi:hypothetical protein IMZ48_19630 [Candidatus Bathyarchaeota archaeon]|nr:hypothetical protein [Candidatus Bathyarchaeota archaeon]
MNPAGSANANEAIHVSLKKPTKNGPKPYKTFNPRFTYPIFGDDEQIFGYKNLAVDLRFRANDMRPFVKISYSKKFDTIGDTEPTDVEGILKEVLPAVAFGTEEDFVEGSKQLSPTWKPPGKLHSTLPGDDGETYEVWKGSLADPAVKQMIKRMQILALLFIEGGSTIVDDADSRPNPTDPRWTVFFLFRRDKETEDPRTTYTFIGYSTIFRFFYMSKEDITPASTRPDQELLPSGEFDLAQVPCRSRLSQFLILPPFQNAGNGARLYETIFDYYYHHAPTKVLTVEDPNEAFDDLRDVCDLAFLRTLPGFSALRLREEYQVPKKGIVKRDFLDLEAIGRLLKQSKMSERQFMRCVEMQLMSTLPASVRPSIPERGVSAKKPKATPADKHLYELWRLWVKMRLYVHNKDALGELEQGERIEKLDETLGGVEFEYVRLLSICDRRAKKGGKGVPKRKAGEVEGAEGSSSKRARVEDLSE